jgi:hypothetical protein
MLRECRETPYLQDLSINFRRAVDVWTLMYRHVLEVHRHSGEWLFLHYDQLLDGSAFPSLKEILGVEPDRLFPDPALRRSAPQGKVGRAARDAYGQLCRLARFSD